MIILPSSYLPSISYVAHLRNHGAECVVDLGEHYIKRSVRNRTRIMTAQGVMELTIPVKRANKPRQAMSTIEIDYSKRWQHQHWNAIVAAYRSSPYFEHYAPLLEPLYKREWQYLVDFNEAILGVILKVLRLTGEVNYSQEYVAATPSDTDFRPKHSLEMSAELRPYIQVFEDRLPFEADLSILDLLLCEGPSAFDYVGASRR